MYVCICHAVTERQVRTCVDAGATTLSDLQFELGVATRCGSCAATAAEYLPGGKCSRVGELRSLARSATSTSTAAEAAHSVSVSLAAPA